MKGDPVGVKGTPVPVNGEPVAVRTGTAGKDCDPLAAENGDVLGSMDRKGIDQNTRSGTKTISSGISLNWVSFVVSLR